MVDIKCLASGSTGNAYIVSDLQTTILIECGIKWKQILTKSDFIAIDACLVSHSHKDHCKAVNDVLKAGIDVYMSEETKEALSLSRHNLHTITALENFHVGSFVIQPFSVSHDVANMGFILTSSLTNETVVFFTDAYYVRYRFPDTNYWIIECNFIREKLDQNFYENETSIHLRNRIVKTHMSLETLKDMLKANDLTQTKEIYLTHLSDTNSDTERMKKEIQELTGKVVYVCE